MLKENDRVEDMEIYLGCFLEVSEIKLRNVDVLTECLPREYRDAFKMVLREKLKRSV